MWHTQMLDSTVDSAVFLQFVDAVLCIPTNGDYYLRRNVLYDLAENWQTNCGDGLFRFNRLQEK